jgi:nicotinamidase/pyrazinamidase
MEAIVLVDIQNDFLPTGALPVPRGDEVIAVANQLIREFSGFVVATQDWHPLNHGSFAANHPGKKPYDVVELAGVSQVLWPVHCVEGTPGAAFAPGLAVARIERVVVKGTDPTIDSYSGFFDNGRRKATELEAVLREKGVTRVRVLGLATDYCVKATALDARSLGFETSLVLAGCRGVDVNAGDSERAVEELRAAGVRIIEG